MRTKGARKRTLMKPAAESPKHYLLLLSTACTPPLQTSNNLCLSEQARFHSSLAQYFFRRKEKTSRMRRTNQFERPDKFNKLKVYFRAFFKWVLRYCITLFMQVYFLIIVCVHVPVYVCECLCASVCASAHVSLC